jgi:hypothetical protein
VAKVLCHVAVLEGKAPAAATTRGLVRRHRRRIGRVARALLKRGALAQEAIDTLILTVANAAVACSRSLSAARSRSRS